MLKKIINFLITSILLVSCNNSKFESATVDFTNIENNSIIQKDTNNIKVIVAARISPKETYYLYKDLFNYTSEKINIPIKIYQRKTYLEANELLSQNSVDIGFVCTGAYLKNKSNCELLAIPVFNNRPYYQAYIIANKKNKLNSINDLKQKTFAFTDPLSNTGKLYPEKRIKELFNIEADLFFKSITYSGSHDISIQLVSKGIVDGASVDGLIYEYLLKNSPDVVKNIYIIEKSECFGAPPIVNSKGFNIKLKAEIQKVLINMHNDSSGKIILNKLMIDKFILPVDSIYNSASLNCKK